MGLEGLPILPLKHHVEMFPASMAFISLVSVDIKGFEVINCSSVEDLPVLRLVRGLEVEGGGFPVGIGMRGHGVCIKICLESCAVKLAGRLISTRDLFGM